MSDSNSSTDQDSCVLGQCATAWVRAIRVLAAVVFVVAAATPSAALPVFARRYQTACTTCHVAVPKLNAFGIAFRNNGYRIPAGEEHLVHDPDVELGAPAWKRVWPRAVWPGSLPYQPPVAFRVASEAAIRPSAPVQLDFNFPSGVNLYAVGSEGAGISFFGNLFISGTGALSVDRAYAQFRLTPDAPGRNLLTLKVGRIDTRAEPFSHTFRRTTSRAFNVSDFRPVTGAFGLRDHDAGIEAWGAVTGPHDRGGLEYAAGLVQGTAGRAENNNFKDYYGAVSYKFSGLGVVGPRHPASDAAFEEPVRERSLTLGAFSYTGRGVPAGAGILEDRFTRHGVKADLWVGPVNLYGAYVRGTDAVIGSAATTVQSRASMAQADYLLLPWVMPSLRVERTTYSGRPAVVAVVPAVSVLVRANIRVLGEAHIFNEAVSATGTRLNANDGVVRLEFMF